VKTRLVLGLCFIFLGGCSHGFREEDVAAAKTSIQNDFQNKGFTVEEVVLVRDSDNTKLSGYVKLQKKLPLLKPIEITKPCTATMDAGNGSYFWECR